MSCDLTVHVEIKINGQWHHYNHFIADQNYAFFGMIAGVRKPELKIFEPKGLPTDLSPVTEINRKKYEEDLHNPTWLTPNELRHVINQHEDHALSFPESEGVQKSFGYLFGGSPWNAHLYRNSFPPEIEDVRFVMWFDN